MEQIWLGYVPEYRIAPEFDESLFAREQNMPVYTAWREDKAIIPAAVRTETEAAGLAAELTAFEGTAGEIKAECARIFYVEDTMAFPGNGKDDDGTRISCPDVLNNVPADRLEAGKVQYLWIEVSVPKEAAAGLYTAKLTVKTREPEYKAELLLCVKVLELAADKSHMSKEFDLELWQYPYRSAQYYGLEPFGDKHLAVLREHLAMYREMGGHAVTASVVEEPWNGQTYGSYPSMIKWFRKTDGEFRFDFNDFDKWVGLCRECGIGDKVVCYSMIPWENQVTFWDEADRCTKKLAPNAGTEEYAKLWIPFLEALRDHCEELGWEESICIGIDERPDMEKAFDVVESVKKKNGKPFMISAAMNHFSAEYFPVIDRLQSVSISSDSVKGAPEDFNALIARRKTQQELDTTVYTCVGHFPNSFAYSLPAESYWTIMYCGRLGATGFLRWAYDAWVEEPLKDTTHISFEAGDCFLIYPDVKSAAMPQARTSVRYEMLGKGIRDLNKLRSLAAWSKEWNRKVDELLHTVRTDYGQEHDGIANSLTKEELPRDMSAFENRMNALFEEFSKEERQ